MKRILVVVHIESCFPPLLGLARVLRESGRYEPIVLLPAEHYLAACLPRDLARCEAAGFSGPPAAGGTPAAGRGPRAALRAVLPRRVRERLAGNDYVIAASQYRALKERVRRVRAIVREGGFAAVVLGLDLPQYDTAAYVRAAHEEGRPAIIVTDIMTSASEFGEAYGRNPLHRVRGALGRLVRARYPGWVLSYEGRTLVRLPSPGMILARERLGLAPPLPWQIHSGAADAILVESERVREAAVASGLDARVVHATGLSSHDAMARALADPEPARRELRQRLGLREGRPLILLALPQDDQPVGLPLPFPSYRELIAFLATALAACRGYDTVVCPHPSTLHEDVRFLERTGVKIAPDPTSSLVPLCRIFVATISSTIKWAIACGKPVIAYDYNRQHRQDFAGAGGVLLAQTREEFLEHLARLTGDGESCERAARAQARCARAWGNLDGRAGERILELFDRLTAPDSGGAAGDRTRG